MPDDVQPAWQQKLIEPYADTPLQSVGGWLFVFCISYGIFSPIALLRGVRLTSPIYWTFTYIVLAILMFLAGASAGLRTRSAFTFIAFALAMRVIFAAMRLTLAHRLHSHNLKPEFATREMWMAVGNIAGSVIWFWYFKVSSRVKRTFGRNL